MLKRSEIHLGRKGFLMKVFEHVFKKRPIGLSRADMVHALLNWMDDSANHALIASSGDWADLLDEPDSSEEKHSTIDDDALWKPIEDKAEERKLNTEFWNDKRVSDEMETRVEPKSEGNDAEPTDWEELGEFVESLKTKASEQIEEQSESELDSGGAISPVVGGNDENQDEDTDENDFQVENEEVVEDDAVVGSQLLNDVIEQEASPNPSWTDEEIGEMYQSHVEQNSSPEEPF